MRRLPSLKQARFEKACVRYSFMFHKRIFDVIKATLGYYATDFYLPYSCGGEACSVSSLTRTYPLVEPTTTDPVLAIRTQSFHELSSRLQQRLQLREPSVCLPFQRLLNFIPQSACGGSSMVTSTPSSGHSVASVDSFSTWLKHSMSSCVLAVPQSSKPSPSTRSRLLRVASSRSLERF